MTTSWDNLIVTTKDAAQNWNQFQSIDSALSSAELTPCNYRNLKVKKLTWDDETADAATLDT